MKRSWKSLAVSLLLVMHGPALCGQTGQARWAGLDGLWWVRVEGLDIWAPPEARDKELALVLWELSFVDGKLRVKQYAPGSEDSVVLFGKLRDLPFEDVRIRDLLVEDSFLSFKVRGVSHAYEAYRLENVSDNEVTGSYLAYNPWGAPSHDPEYRGRLYLQRVRE